MSTPQRFARAPAMYNVHGLQLLGSELFSRVSNSQISYSCESHSVYHAHEIHQPIPKIQFLNFHHFFSKKEGPYQEVYQNSLAYVVKKIMKKNQDSYFWNWLQNYPVIFKEIMQTLNPIILFSSVEILFYFSVQSSARSHSFYLRYSTLLTCQLLRLHYTFPLVAVSWPFSLTR